MSKHSRIVKQFIDLVTIDSESGKERDIADYLLSLFEELGIEAYEDGTAEITGHSAGNIIAKIPGNSKGTPIFFTSHMDTVVPGNNIKPIIKDGYIYSDGKTILGADDKAGIAGIIETIHQLKEDAIDHDDIYIVLTSGEETGLVGSGAFQEDLPVQYGYALDSNGEIGKIISAAPSQARMSFVIKGKSSHAGVSPEKGISAITMAAKAISKMPLGRIDAETTANIGSFEGKGPTNIVCDQVSIIAEARSLNQDKLEKQIQAMEEAIMEVTEKMGGAAEIDKKQMYYAYSYTESDAVVKTAMQAVTNLGRKAEVQPSGGGSDANHFNRKGLPTINLGVGYEFIHTKQERIALSELELIPSLIKEIIKLANSK
ncbi:tripeptide aminopeptidase [Gracilibacillus halotolerans]|uniref:Tripeptide aminopeptidase n=1 Tax=Gracilibacillus halotolerans TaxID=74386 RepID=A0A841RGX4_9BACI|nr:M20/M25/M40 family metallo-hydrolase [Gracilibacillus halotolerans]MBB6511729.1 tripeptide aminopeptidase [Gracilibacillus halotolerans]